MNLSSLFSALLASVPGGKALPSEPGPSPAPTTAAKSFLNVMSELHAHEFSVPPRTMATSGNVAAPEKASSSTVKVTENDASRIGTAKIAVALPQTQKQPRNSGSSRKAISVPAATALPKAFATQPAKPVTVNYSAADGKDAPPAETVTAASPLPAVAGKQTGKPAAVKSVNSNDTSTSNETASQPLIKTSDNDTGTADTPTPMPVPISVDPSSGIVPILSQTDVAPLVKPIAAKVSSDKTAPIVQRNGSQPLAEASGRSDSSKETLGTPVSSPQVEVSGTGKSATPPAPSSKSAPENDSAPVAAKSVPDNKTASAPPAKTTDQQSSEQSILPKAAAPKAEEIAGSTPQQVVFDSRNTLRIGSSVVVSGDGTGGALSDERMNLNGKKNQNPTASEQNVPSASQKDALSARPVTGAALGSGFNSSGQKLDSADSSLLVNWSSKSSEWPVEASKATGAAVSVDHSATQAERIGHLVTQQVTMMRQSGANNVAVSLRVDANTELNLKLTNHNGQIQASVRWEQGSATAPLDNHWKDLQQSLAKLNVQLMPSENRASARMPSQQFTPNTSTGGFSGSSQNPQRQGRQQAQEFPLADASVTAIAATATVSKPTTRTVSRQGWESWA
jgi:hypothetical protein